MSRKQRSECWSKRCVKGVAYKEQHHTPEIEQLHKSFVKNPQLLRSATPEVRMKFAVTTGMIIDHASRPKVVYKDVATVMKGLFVRTTLPMPSDNIICDLAIAATVGFYQMPAGKRISSTKCSGVVFNHVAKAVDRVTATEMADAKSLEEGQAVAQKREFLLFGAMTAIRPHPDLCIAKRIRELEESDLPADVKEGGLQSQKWIGEVMYKLVPEYMSSLPPDRKLGAEDLDYDYLYKIASIHCSVYTSIFTRCEENKLEYLSHSESLKREYVRRVSIALGQSTTATMLDMTIVVGTLGGGAISLEKALSTTDGMRYMAKWRGTWQRAIRRVIAENRVAKVATKEHRAELDERRKIRAAAEAARAARKEKPLTPKGLSGPVRKETWVNPALTEAETSIRAGFKAISIEKAKAHLQVLEDKEALRLAQLEERREWIHTSREIGGN